MHFPATVGGGVAAAIAGSNLLVLAQDCEYLSSLNAQLLAGVASNRRDALDLAGKLPLAIKALAVGISPAELNIDPSQAGGLLGKFDAKITRVGACPRAVLDPALITPRNSVAGRARAHTTCCAHHLLRAPRTPSRTPPHTPRHQRTPSRTPPHTPRQQHHADPQRGGIEVKGARSYRGRKTFQFSRLRPSTPFEHLLFVARERDPANWTDASRGH